MAGALTPTFSYDLLGADDQRLGALRGVEGGSLSWSAATTVKAGGSLRMVEVDKVNWLAARVQIWRHVGGLTWPRGIYIPSVPKVRIVNGVKRFDVELLGKLSLLAQVDLDDWISLPAGTVITTAVKQLLLAAGHTRIAITDSTAVLRTSMTWSPADEEVTLLSVINDLLAAAGYWSLQADDFGTFVAEPYVRPADRSPRYDLLDGDYSIYVDDLDIEEDIFKIPNRIKGIGASDSDVPPLISVIENQSLDSPYSIPNRGGMIISKTVSGVEAATQQILDAELRRLLIEESSVTSSMRIQTAPLPIDLNNALRFQRQPAGINALYTVQNIQEDLESEALLDLTLRKVVDL